MRGAVFFGIFLGVCAADAKESADYTEAAVRQRVETLVAASRADPSGRYESISAGLARIGNQIARNREEGRFVYEPTYLQAALIERHDWEDDTGSTALALARPAASIGHLPLTSMDVPYLARMVLEENHELAAKALSRCRDLRTLDVWLVVQQDHRLRPLGSRARDYIRLWSGSSAYREALARFVATNGDRAGLSWYLKSEEQRHWDRIAEQTEKDAAQLSSLVEDVLHQWNRGVLLSHEPRDLFSRFERAVAVSRKVDVTQRIKVLLPELPDEEDARAARRALAHVEPLADRDNLWKTCLANPGTAEREALMYGWTDADGQRLAGLLDGQQGVPERDKAIGLALSLPPKYLNGDALTSLRELADTAVPKLSGPGRAVPDPATQAQWILMRLADPVDLLRFRRWLDFHGAGVLSCMARAGADVTSCLEKELTHANPDRRRWASQALCAHYWKYACAYFAGTDLRLPNSAETNLRLARAILSTLKHPEIQGGFPYSALVVLLRDDLNRPAVRLEPAEYADLAGKLLQDLKTPEQPISEHAFYLLEVLDRPEFEPVDRLLAGWPTAPRRELDGLARDRVKANSELARLILAARKAARGR